MNAHDEHVWFQEQIAAAITSGLSPEERSRFAAHAEACEACRAELDRATSDESALVDLFETARPTPGLEDRLIRSLRAEPSPRRAFVHPYVRRAATGVAAAIVLGGLGAVLMPALQSRRMPDVHATAQRVTGASNLRQIGDAVLLHSNENKNADPHLADSAGRFSGFKLNNSISGEYAVSSDIQPSSPPAAGPNQGGQGAGDRTYMAGTSFGVKPQISTSEDIQAGTKDGYLYWDGGDKKQPAAGVPGQGGPAAGGEEARGTGTAARFFRPALLGVELQAGKDADGDEKLGKQSGAMAAGAQPQQMQQLQQKIERQASTIKEQQRVAQDLPALHPIEENETLQRASESSPATRPGAPAAQVSSRKVIRSGQLEFEVDRFDSAFARVHQLTTEAGGYIGSTDSQKLPNGKVKGTVALRVPPDRLDTLVLQLRGIGDLKSQKLGADDVSKQYWDFDSELRAARAMEERLIEIIKTGKGEIKDLLAAEKELGVWRGKIEKLTGEMKYLDNLVALATLHVTMFEKDLATPAALVETETIEAGVETADVEAARAAALKAIDEAKGRIVQSDMKRYDAGQFGATIVADVAPDRAGPLLDRIKQLGKVARLDVQRRQSSEGTPTAASPVNRVERRDTRLNLSLYNLANVAPRHTTTLTLAAADVEAAHRTLLERSAKAGGRVVTSAVTRDKPEQTSGTITFEVPAAEVGAVEQDVRAAGEVLTLARGENPDSANVTTAKHGFSVRLVAAAGVPPRETTSLQLAAADVAAARDALLAAARAAGARVIGAQLDENEPQNVSATLDLDVPRDALPSIDAAIGSVGDTLTRASRRAPNTDQTLDSKVHVQVSITGAARLPPREITTLSIELRDVDAALASLQQAAAAAGGRTIQSDLSKGNDGSTVGRLVVELPLAKAGPLVDQAKGLGNVRAIDARKNAQVPEGKLSKARVEVTLGNTGAIIGPDEGLWATVRRALATSAAGLLWSLQLVIIGLCFVLPWVLVLWGGWRLLRRQRAAPAPSAAAS